jgi:hypothetical protein
MVANLGEREQERLWEFTLHEDGVFNDRQNLFLVAESMFAVAYAMALDAKRGGVALVIAIVGLLLTLAWLYVSVRHSLIVDLIQQKAKEQFPDYAELYRKRDWCWLPFRSRTVVAFVVPMLVGALWVALLVARL